MKNDKTEALSKKIHEIKKSGSFEGKSNKLGHGGRAAQLKAEGVPGGVIGEIARRHTQLQEKRIFTANELLS